MLKNQIQDKCMEAIAGYSGKHLQEKLVSYLRVLGGTGTELGDLWHSMMDANAVPKGALNDRQRQWMAGLGIPLGNIDGMFYEYWSRGPY